MLPRLFLSFLVVVTFLGSRSNSKHGVLAASSESEEESREKLFPHSDEGEYWAWGSSEEEGECGDEEFWHIRGKRCVPYVCPRGNSKRNFETGVCLYDGDATEGEVQDEQNDGSLLNRAVWSGFYQPKGRSSKMIGGKQEGFVNRRKSLHDKFQAWVHKMKEIDETR